LGAGPRTILPLLLPLRLLPLLLLLLLLLLAGARISRAGSALQPPAHGAVAI
jgi:hypothetical protein